MKLSHKINFKILKLIYLLCIICKTYTLNLQKITKASDFYQVTSFVSDNFTKILNSEASSFYDCSRVTYSFRTNQKIYNNTNFDNAVKIMYSLQGSLVIFHTSNLNEIKSFIDFLIPQLSVRKRPKSLVKYSTENVGCNDEIDIIDFLKYAWDKKFLDFSVIVTRIGNEEIVSCDLMYHYNPFNDVVYEKELDEDIDIFPDKLLNAHEYPFIVASKMLKDNTVHIKRPYGKVKIINRNEFVVQFTAIILNLRIVKKKFTGTVLYDDMKKYNFDMDAFRVYNRNYTSSYLIPAVDQRANEVIAFVPIIPTSRIDLLFKIMYNLMMIFGMICIILYLLNHFQSVIGSIEVFDVVRLLLSQSINRKPKNPVEVIIILTVVGTSFIVMNDVLTDIISILFDKREVPFETYEDLYSSQLKIYTDLPFLKDLQNITDPFLEKILKKSLRTWDCAKFLEKRKNASCIFIPFDPEHILTITRNPEDKSPMMKIAKPPIDAISVYFYWFADASPYAMKFLEIMQRIKETALMHVPALIDKKPFILNVEETEPTFDKINLEQLLTITGFGLLISVTAFVIELIVPPKENKKIKRSLQQASSCIHGK